MHTELKKNKQTNKKTKKEKKRIKYTFKDTEDLKTVL